MAAHALKTRRWLPIVAALALVFLAAGCDTNSSAPDPNESISQTEEIDDPYGGFNTSDEMSGFGDPFLLGTEGEVDYDDEVAEDPEVQAFMELPETALYGVRLTWGYLSRDSSHVNDPVDWSGNAVVDSGALIVARTIQFEPGQDSIVRPVSLTSTFDRKRVEWISQTTVAFDGVQLLFVDPTGGGGPNPLTVSVPLLEATFSLNELAEIDTTYEVDHAGHQVRVQARRLELTLECRRGWLSGRWYQIDSTTDDQRPGIMGRFLGHWSDAQGNLGGAVRGFYGVNRNGHQVMFGKIINREGEFVGLLRGMWNHADSPGCGAFRAMWVSARHQTMGGLRGIWERRGMDGAGFFQGHWRNWCDDGNEEIDPGIF